MRAVARHQAICYSQYRAKRGCDAQGRREMDIRASRDGYDRLGIRGYRDSIALEAIAL